MTNRVYTHAGADTASEVLNLPVEHFLYRHEQYSAKLEPTSKLLLCAGLGTSGLIRAQVDAF